MCRKIKRALTYNDTQTLQPSDFLRDGHLGPICWNQPALGWLQVVQTKLDFNPELDWISARLLTRCTIWGGLQQLNDLWSGWSKILVDCLTIWTDPLSESQHGCCIIALRFHIFWLKLTPCLHLSDICHHCWRCCCLFLINDIGTFGWTAHHLA